MVTKKVINIPIFRSKLKIIVVDNGKIVGQGKHEELLRTSELYKEINDSQMRRGE